MLSHLKSKFWFGLLKKATNALSCIQDKGAPWILKVLMYQKIKRFFLAVWIFLHRPISLMCWHFISVASWAFFFFFFPTAVQGRQISKKPSLKWKHYIAEVLTRPNNDQGQQIRTSNVSQITASGLDFELHRTTKQEWTEIKCDGQSGWNMGRLILEIFLARVWELYEIQNNTSVKVLWTPSPTPLLMHNNGSKMGKNAHYSFYLLDQS